MVLYVREIKRRFTGRLLSIVLRSVSREEPWLVKQLTWIHLEYACRTELSNFMTAEGTQFVWEISLPRLESRDEVVERKAIVTTPYYEDEEHESEPRDHVGVKLVERIPEQVPERDNRQDETKRD
jgi:hypothetical protein